MIKCKHCGGDLNIRKPKSTCDHLYYPDNCKECKQHKYDYYTTKFPENIIKERK